MSDPTPHERRTDASDPIGGEASDADTDDRRARPDGSGDESFAGRLGHVHLKVRDVDRAVEFYTDVVPGLTVSQRAAGFVFLSADGAHHELALQAVNDDSAPGPESERVGLYHTAWEVSEATVLRRVYDRLRERDIPVTPIDHGISKAIYFDDPDGNGVELYLDTREANDQYEWDGHDEPFDPAAL